ncbi:MAG: hypothetical protein KDC66_16750 [Phaeodactylibacter sp.]|nr:hypothetical protein [Phaeodactylibacter sp.]MCB9273666.1 hypothetical protein [Lewinellaceae bacterium]
MNPLYQPASLSRSILPVLLFAAMLFTRPLSGQETMVATDKADATGFNLVHLPPLDTLNAVHPPSPYYEFLWIFSDGNFINKSLERSIDYQYDLKGAATASVQTQAIATSIYTGGAPPPRIIVLDTTVVAKAGVSKKSTAVKPGLFINLQRNHTRMVPLHTSTWILSVRNNFTQDSSQYLNGNLLLFYDGLIELIVTQENGDTLLVPKTDAADLKVFSDFTETEVLNFFGGSSGNRYMVADPQVSEYYKEVYVIPFEKLFPQEERHYFINLLNDKDLLDKAPEKEKGQVRFMAAGILNDPPQLSPVLSGEEQERVQQLGLPPLLDNGLPVTDPIEGNTFNLPLGTLLMDVHENAAGISKGHDPNKLAITTCECPAGSEVGQKLLFTVDFENDGAGDVDKVIIKLDLPDGVSPSRIPDTLVHSHPFINPDDIKITRGEKSVTWELKDLIIHPVMDFGAGHPSTYGSISFYAFLETGKDVSILDGQQAYIYFYSETNDPVFTPPAEISLLTPADQAYELGDFNCGQCVAPSIDVTSSFPLPWWLVILILLIIGFAVLFAFLRRSNT